MKKRSFEEWINLVKKLTNEGKDITMSVKNKNTKGYGVASFTLFGEVKVWEGAEDGSDDKIYTLEQYKKNYEILKLQNEFEEDIEVEEEFE